MEGYTHGPSGPEADQHEGWLERWRAVKDFINRHPTGAGAEVAAAESEQLQLENQIVGTRARTLAGVTAQARWLALDASRFWLCTEHRKVTDHIISALEDIT